MNTSINRSSAWCVMAVLSLTSSETCLSQPISAEQIQEQLSKPRVRTLRNLQVEKVQTPAAVPSDQSLVPSAISVPQTNSIHTANHGLPVPPDRPTIAPAPVSLPATIVDSITTPVSSVTPVGAPNPQGASALTSNDNLESSLAKYEPAQIALQIQFEFNSTKVTPQGEMQIRELAKALASPSLERTRFQVQGHTDSVGRADYNLKLSHQRADSIARTLQSFGIKKERLNAKGLGQTQPLSEFPPSAPEQRRVVIVERP
jgi:outer membrane protein OmpA-like peptidoglycan-associated protein